jgi:Uma2 family endonuclease
LVEPELHLGGDIIVPDIAGWRQARMPAMATDAFTDVPPDWVCEGLSPSTMAFDRGPKMDLYARELVPYLWLFDPTAQTLETYRLDNRRWLRLGAWSQDATVRAEPFEAVELPLARLWARR